MAILQSLESRSKAAFYQLPNIYFTFSYEGSSTFQM
jgi:hypothetical protein